MTDSIELMTYRLFCCSAFLAASFWAASLMAQSAGRAGEEQKQRAYAAHMSDFDYLLGDWEFTAESKQFGKLEGRWSAVRLATGQIMEEYRVLGRDGETIYATTTIRSYNSASGPWELIGMEPGGGLRDFGTAQRVGGEMRLQQKFGVAGGRPVTMRIRYYNIKPDRFSWSADRSTDNGKTWLAKFQTIEAHRIGPARSLGPLASARPERHEMRNMPGMIPT